MTPAKLAEMRAVSFDAVAAYFHSMCGNNPLPETAWTMIQVWGTVHAVACQEIDLARNELGLRRASSVLNMAIAALDRQLKAGVLTEHCVEESLSLLRLALAELGGGK